MSHTSAFSSRRGSSTLRASTVDRQYIQRLAVLYDPECDRDAQRLQQALEETLETAGPDIGGVEVYKYRDRLGDLEWLEGLGREEDRKDNHNKPDPVLPGTGLVGTLWTAQTATSSKRQSSTGSLNSLRFRSSLRRSSQQPTPEGTVDSAETLEVPPKASNGLQWRDLKSINMDPDTWQCPRVQAHLQKGLHKAAGVCFKSHGIQGMVVYYATQEHQGTLPQTVFLQRSASYIGSMVAMTEARRACCCFRDQQCEKNQNADEEEEAKESPKKHPPPKRLSTPDVLDVTSKTSTGMESSIAADNPTCLDTLSARMVAWYHKCWGGGLQIPPAMELQQVCWTWLGAFCGLLVLSSIDRLFFHLSDGDYQLVIGPFGAMMTLLYALPSAPASQPRNVVLGEAIAGAVAMSLSYLPLPTWIRRAVSPAFGIAAMTACGVVHPPAGAHATIWADSTHNWGHYAIVVLCSAVSVLPATIINNMSVKRQYPTYWGYLPKWLYYKVFGGMSVEEQKARESVRRKEREFKEEKNNNQLSAASETNNEERTA